MKRSLLMLAMLLAMGAHAQYNFYFGNLHAHSNYSDGNKDSTTTGYYIPADDYNYAKGSFHMDFLGISEHNHYSSSKNPGMRVSLYSRGLFQADTANHNGSFVCLYGFEWGVISNGGHVVTYGVPQLVGWETGSGGWGASNNYDIFCAKSDYKSFWPIVNSYPGAFCTLAHPQTNDYTGLADTAAYSLVADNAVAGTAIRSGSANSTTTNYSDPAPTLYESVYLSALKKGYHIGPVADQDNHYTTFGRTNHIRTVVLASSLNRDSILAAYRAMRFYASDDWDAKVSFTINGNFMGADFTSTSNSSIAVSVNDPANNVGAADPISKIEIYSGIMGSGSNATILTSNTGSTTLNFVHTTTAGTQYYYFVKVTEADGDIIWTSPIWVNRTTILLPVEITRFDGKENKGNADLVWTTSQENNNDHFDIERSVDGVHFEKAGTVASKYHTTSLPTDYTFTDTHAKNSTNFYRLKQVDINGDFRYSVVIAVDIDKPIVRISRVFPNPAVTMLNISCFAEDNENVVCKFYNTQGREVKSMTALFSKGENTIAADVSSLPKGVYFITISKPDMRMAEGSFIKQ